MLLIQQELLMLTALLIQSNAIMGLSQRPGLLSKGQVALLKKKRAKLA